MKTFAIDLDDLLKDLKFKSRESCLEGAVIRAVYFFKKIDGGFEIPECHPQVKQILELVIAAANK